MREKRQPSSPVRAEKRHHDWLDAWFLLLLGIPMLAETAGAVPPEHVTAFAVGDTLGFLVFVYGVVSGRLSPTRKQWEVQISRPRLLQITLAAPIMGAVLFAVRIISWQDAVAFGVGYAGILLLLVGGAPLAVPSMRRLEAVGISWPILFLIALLVPLIPLLPWLWSEVWAK
ncbi:MAG: hypothetical protein OXG96_04390 [Acidobacteria bacterium]|nr:hypothetical protein [Acidobacteriota bacterium]